MEVLIGLAFLLIVAAFLSPNLKDDFGRPEMSKAMADLNRQLEMARIAARRLDSEITVDFHQDLRARYHSVSFILPGETDPEAALVEYVLPENIRLFSPDQNVRFDRYGNAELPTQIELMSERNRFLSERLLVE